jgi:hypothetical protein
LSGHASLFSGYSTVNRFKKKGATYLQVNF